MAKRFFDSRVLGEAEQTLGLRQESMVSVVSVSLSVFPAVGGLCLDGAQDKTYRDQWSIMSWKRLSFQLIPVALCYSASPV